MALQEVLVEKITLDPALCPYLHSFGNIPLTKTELSRNGPRTGHVETQTAISLPESCVVISDLMPRANVSKLLVSQQ